MKTLKIFTYASLLSGLGLLFGLSACQGEKEAVTQPKVEVNTAKVTSLVTEIDRKGVTPREAEDFLARFKSMNADELDLFNRLDGEKAKTVYKDQPAALGEIDRVLAYRKNALQASLKMFAKPYNQLSPDQMDVVFTTLKASENAARTAACPKWFSNTAFTTAYNDGLINETWGQVEPNNQGDCDCWIRYPNYIYGDPSIFRHVQPYDLRATTLLNYHGNLLLAHIQVANPGIRSIIFGRDRGQIVYFFPCYEASGGLRLTFR
ncbi:MAG: hypothetical protein AVDCRST_MAG56-5371 [uncultured Cytophagales bacterium]|uniref:Uncharacterized protein n=1 Tax=uncultured Cytophagales bacterium TaxID=158755 RepID=A0A6J4K925_9SPHI|nr:MAG: hypothetical protein AVDCRST_MAG56-5371 [uncultured Cytophagales bacterium]